MNELRKKRMKTIMKYSWPFYLVATVLIVFGMNFIFGITHRIPVYKTLTLFISGEMKDNKGLQKYLLEKYQDNELKQVSCISSNPSDPNYQSKLSIAGYNTADILFLPLNILDNLNVSVFALDLNAELINTYYADYTLYQQNEINYGIKIDKERIKDYFTLPSEDCYMILNGKSENTGKYSPKQIEEHNTALKLSKEWGI